MRNVIISLMIGLLIMSGCTGVRTVSKGLDNQCFIAIIGNPRDYLGGLEAIIDESYTFKAQVNTTKTKFPNGLVYALSSGKHLITLTYKKKVIYSKTVFISAQETKEIVLQ